MTGVMTLQLKIKLDTKLKTKPEAISAPGYWYRLDGIPSSSC